MKSTRLFLRINYRLILLAITIICLTILLSTMFQLVFIRQERKDEFSDYYNQSSRIRFYSEEKKQEIQDNETVNDIIGFNYFNLGQKYGFLNIDNNNLFDYVTLIDGERISNSNQAVASDLSNYKIGDTFSLDGEDISLEFVIVGIYKHNIWQYFSNNRFNIITNNRNLDNEMIYDVFMNDDNLDFDKYGISIPTYQDTLNKYNELSEYLENKYDWIYWFGFLVIGIILLYCTYIFSEQLYKIISRKYLIFLPPVIILALFLIALAIGIDVPFAVILPYVCLAELMNILLYYKEDKNAQVE